MVLIAIAADCNFSVDVLLPNETMDAKRYHKFINDTLHRWRSIRTSPLRVRDGNVLWQHDNARPHSACSTGQLFESKGIRLIKQAPYSPDLNILDRKIKEELNRKNLKNHIEVIQETRNVLRKL